MESAFGRKKEEKKEKITEEEKEIAKKLIIEYAEFAEKKQKVEKLKNELREKAGSRMQIKTEIGIVDVVQNAESTVIDIQKLKKMYPDAYEKCRKLRKANKSILIKNYK